MTTRQKKLPRNNHFEVLAAIVRFARTLWPSRVRDSHAAVGVDGQVRDIGDPFVLGDGVTLLYPLDPSGPPGDVINCRCVAIPVVAEV